MYQFILFIHVFAAVLIVALVLVQQGKGATLGAAFGSGASQTVFGSRGSGSFLFRVTVSLVALFFITSLTLNYLATQAYKQERRIILPAAPKLNNQNSVPTYNDGGANTSPNTGPSTENVPSEVPERSS